MHDYQQLISAIKVVLQSATIPTREQLDELAQRYAQACAAVNERLASCASLLRAGLRTEAIYEAEMEPNLLDSAAALDFPERAAFVEWLVANELSLPPTLLIDHAAELNAQYAIERNLDDVLRRHRRLALRHAPLVKRCAQLRILAQRDPNNLIWREDLVAMENAAQEELQAQAKAAFARGDRAGLELIRKQLISTPWTVPPSRSLLDRVDQQHAQLQRTDARDHLSRLVDQLQRAQAAEDVETARALRETWRQLLSLAALAPGDPLLEAAAAPLEWLAYRDARQAQHERHAEAVNRFTNALDENASREVLDRLYHALASLEDGVPLLLERRYRQRLCDLDVTHRRKMVLSAVVALGVLGLIAAGSAWGYREYAHGRLVAEQSQAIRNLTASGNPKAALDLAAQIEKTAPSVHASAPVQEAIAAAQMAQNEERARAQQFAAALAAYEDSIQQLHQVFASFGSESGGNLASAHKTLSELSNARIKFPSSGAREAAEKAAKTDLQKGQLAAADARANDLRLQIDVAMRTTYLVVVAEYQRQLAAFKMGSGSPEAVQAAGAELEKFIARHQLVAAEVRKEAEILLKELKALHAERLMQRAQWDRLESLKKKIGNLQAYRQALTAFAQDFPQAASTPDLRQAASEVMLWQELEELNQVVARMRKTDLARLTPEAAHTLVEDLKQAEIRAKPFPQAALFQYLLPVLQRVAARKEGSAADLIEELNFLFNEPVIQETWLVRTHDNKSYYAAVCKEIGDVDVLVSLEYYVTKRRKNRVSLAPKDVKSRSKPGPHTLLANAAKAAIDLRDSAGWEEAFLKALELLCPPDSDAEPPVDPILRLKLFRNTLEAGCNGSLPLQNLLAPIRHVLNENLKASGLDEALDDIAWMDPADEAAERARVLARQCCMALAKLDTKPQQLRQQVLEARAAALLLGVPANQEWTNYRRVGILRRAGADWTCELNPPLAGPVELGVLLPATAPDKPHGLVAIARLPAAGQPQDSVPLSDANLPRSALLEGRAVFLLPRGAVPKVAR